MFNEEILISNDVTNFLGINYLDQGWIRSSPRNDIGSTFKENMEFWSLVTESFFTLDLTPLLCFLPGLTS